MKQSRPRRKKRPPMRESQWTVDRIVPPALMAAGLALMLVAGAIAFNVAAPARTGGVPGSYRRADVPRDPRIAAKLTAASQAFPLDNGCTYPYPYTNCPKADLGLTKTVNHTEVELEADGAGDARRIAGAGVHAAAVSKSLEYEVAVANNGPDGATNVILVDSLPPDVVVDAVTVPGSQVACQVVPPGPGQPTTAVVCTRASLANGASFGVAISVRYVEPAAAISGAGVQPARAKIGLVNTATVLSDEADPHPADNTDTAETVVFTPNSLLTQPSNLGYWMAARDGGVFAFGNARFFGSMGGIKLNQPIVGMAATRSGDGYWLVASDGGIFAFGDARFEGSTGGISLARPIVGMTATPTGGGYWLVASDGGIFAFGDAVFYGSTGNITLNKPIVAMAPTPSGHGYWMFASDGGVFGYGDAAFLGSLGAVSLNRPIVGASSSGTGSSLGYYLVASDGGIFSFGNAPFLGAASVSGARSIVAMAALPAQPGGYWLVGADGGVFSFGDAAKFLGSLGGTTLAQPIVAMASRVPAVP